MNSSKPPKIAEKVTGLDDSNLIGSILHFECPYCGEVMSEEEFEGAHIQNCTQGQRFSAEIEEVIPPNASLAKPTVLGRYRNRNTKTKRKKQNKSKSGPPPKDLVCPFCGLALARTNWKQHLDEKHKREVKATPTILCPTCGIGVLLNAYPQHAKDQHTDAKQVTESKQSTKSSTTGVISTRAQDGKDEAFWQSDYEKRDGSKDYAHRFREHGAFGSHPIHDDYSDESDAN